MLEAAVSALIMMENAANSSISRRVPGTDSHGVRVLCVLLAWSEYQVDSRDARYARRAQQILLT